VRFDVVVVGGGVGGLTAAALLAARGAGVCLVERAARVGGCVAPLEEFGYEFEGGAGLYAEWGEGGIHRRVFEELPVAPPEAQRVAPAYVVRLPDGEDVRVGLDDAGQEDELRRAFPECAGAAVGFYRETAAVADTLHEAARVAPDLAAATRFERLRLLAKQARAAPKILAAMNHTAERHLAGASARFRLFVDAQLRLFSQDAADSCAYLYAAVALSQARRGLYALRGGGRALADSLADSIKKSGGAVRLNATALRLVFDARGRAAGVDLLSGERVEASRAVVSNLTAWDTYGKLVGHARTPEEVRARLKSLRGRGAYQIFVVVDEDRLRLLPCERIIAATAARPGDEDEAACGQLMFSATPLWDATAPAGKRAVTVSAPTEVGPWFAHSADAEAHEELDRRQLGRCWERLHAALPELGAGAEVIETETPRGFYERTRRRLGMVGGVGQSLELFGPRALSHRTAIPGLYMSGDTVFPGNGVAAVTLNALAVADEIAPRRP
jgi:C-3',4' desaturase CrtD